jgi:hypothetical protein
VALASWMLRGWKLILGINSFKLSFSYILFVSLGSSIWNFLLYFSNYAYFIFSKSDDRSFSGSSAIFDGFSSTLKSYYFVCISGAFVLENEVKSFLIYYFAFSMGKTNGFYSVYDNFFDIPLLHILPLSSSSS